MTGLPDLPTGWAWSTVAEVGQVQLGRQRAPKYHTGTNMRPYLRVANVFEDRIDTADVMSMHFDPDEFERYRVLPGDILLNEGQSPELLGRPAMYRGTPADVAFTNSLIRFRSHPGIEPEWALTVFRYFMWSGRFTREARITTNIAHLSANRFKTVEFPVPPVEEQRRICDALDAQFSIYNKTLEGLRTLVGSVTVTANSQMGRLRRSLLAAAVHGQLVVQDPADPPADLLLKQIAEHLASLPGSRPRIPSGPRSAADNDSGRPA